MDTVRKWKNFNEEVRRGLIAHAKKKGWKVMKSSEPKFRKGKAEVYMHTDDAVIFATIKNKFGDEKGGKPYAKQYHQDEDLFSGNYKKEKVKKYINQGKASMNYLDKRIGGSKPSPIQRVRRKLSSRTSGGIGSAEWVRKEIGGF